MQVEILQEYLKKKGLWPPPPTLGKLFDVRRWSQGATCKTCLCNTWGGQIEFLQVKRIRRRRRRVKEVPRPSSAMREVPGAIKEVLGETPFWGEGHGRCKRVSGNGRTFLYHRRGSLWIMRENGLLAPFRKRHVHSDGKHDGTIIPSASTSYGEQMQPGCGQKGRRILLGFRVCIDHYNLEPFVRASKSGTKFEALDPVLKAG